MLGPTSLSSRRCATTVLAVLGDLSLVSSEIQGEMCWKIERTRELCQMQGNGGRGEGMKVLLMTC